MATLTELQARLAALEAARADPAKAVEYAGRRVEYRSDGELAAAIAATAAEIARLGGTAARPTTVIVRSGKGW